MSTTVLLVDDHELIRQGLAQSFARHDGIEVIAEASSVAEALVKWTQRRPDVVVTDLRLPDGSGLGVVRAVREMSRTTGIVVLTTFVQDEMLFGAMEAGASAFVGKDTPAENVVRAAKHSAVSPLTFVADGLAEAIGRRTAPGRVTLSDRETQVLALLADGLNTSLIAHRLYVGESTAKTHISRIYQKLGVANRAQALVAAMRLGLLDGAMARPRSPK